MDTRAATAPNRTIQTSPASDPLRPPIRIARTKEQEEAEEAESTEKANDVTERDKMQIDYPSPPPMANDGVTHKDGLTGQERLKEHLPDDNMGAPLNQERPEVEDEPGAKKHKQEQSGEFPSRRATGGSDTSKYSTNNNQDNNGAIDASQEQEISGTALSTPPHYE
ncbi:hypothetical protein MBANPS3_012195 [Mucor bainieri]